MSAPGMSEHVEGCALYELARAHQRRTGGTLHTIAWADCDCAEIDAADRPCIVCQAMGESATKCGGCARELDGRKR